MAKAARAQLALLAGAMATRCVTTEALAAAVAKPSFALFQSTRAQADAQAHELLREMLRSTAGELPGWETLLLVLLGVGIGAMLVLLVAWCTESRRCEACEAVETKPLLAAKDQGNTGMLWAPLVVFAASLPALLGSCCWPLLVAGLLGIAGLSTPSSRATAHAVSFGLHAGVFLTLLPRLASRRSAEPRQGGWFQHWYPFGLAVLGATLMMLDLTRHMCLDLGIGESFLPMYKDDGTLTRVGKAGVACTWLGVFFLFVGIALLTGMPQKVSARLAALRGHQPTDAREGSTAAPSDADSASSRSSSSWERC